MVYYYFTIEVKLYQAHSRKSCLFVKKTLAAMPKALWTHTQTVTHICFSFKISVEVLLYNRLVGFVHSGWCYGVIHNVTSHKDITHNDAIHNDISHKATLFINDYIHRDTSHNSKTQRHYS